VSKVQNPPREGATSSPYEKWKEQTFSRDSESGVYVPVGAGRDFPYSDGDQVESHLLEIVRRASDRAVGSLELARGIRDFPSKYHLSSQRANLLRPVAGQISGRVLVVGAGCGAETRFIGETSAEVWAVEGSRRRAEICAERCRDLPNVSVFCSRIEDFQPPVQFDVVTLIGVLEYSPGLLGSADGPARLLQLCLNLLKPDGVLLLAIENLLGLKYFAGAPEDHIGVPYANMNGATGGPELAPVTFGRAELSRLLQGAGFPTAEFLYPFPDYKFPRLILHSSANLELGEDLGELLRGVASADSSLPYERAFSEEMCWPAVGRNFLVEDLANSFLVVAHRRSAGVVNPNLLAYLYADVRRREYAKETVVQKTPEGLVVQRRKLYDIAAGPARYRQTLQDEEFIRGRLLISDFFQTVNRPEWSEKDIANCGRAWLRLLWSRVIAGSPADPWGALLPRELVDCTPSNLIRRDSGEIAVFDQEWAASEPVPLPFVLFRGLFGVFVHVRSVEHPAHAVDRRVARLCRQVMLEWGVPVAAGQLEELVRRECELQEQIGGLRADPEAYLDLCLPPARCDHRAFAAVTRFDNGVAVAPVLRGCYLDAAPQLRLRWSCAPASTDEGSFFAWLNAVAPIPAAGRYAELPVTHLAAYLYQQRADLRTAFPDLASEDRARFTQWFLQYSRDEYGLDPAFLESTASAWERWSGIRDEIDELRRQAEELRRRAEDAEMLAARYQARDASLQKDLYRKSSRLAAAESRASAMLTAARRYAQAVDHIVDVHRKQRAWKVMLATRRAYTMLVREGWKGRAQLVLGPRAPLDDFEVMFPSLANYLPQSADGDSTGGAPAQESFAEDRPAPVRYDVIVLAIIDFDFRFQRPQQIAAQFARHGHRVFWVAATRVLPADSPEPYRVVPLRDGIWEVHVRAPQFDPYVAVLSDQAVRDFHAGLKQMYRDWAVAETAIIVQLPFWRRLALSLRAEPSSVMNYDCMDDWDTFENLGNFNRTEEEPLAAECDVLSVTAAKLTEKFAARGLNPVLARNGADFAFFSHAAPLPELAGLPRPIVGYFGAIADWIDLDLVCRVARVRPQYTFVLAGQVFGRDISALKTLPNVRFLGSRPYEQMPALLAAFDVAIIPFLLNQVTHATDPVKLYEYLSQGKPVVATNMSELRAWSDIVYLATGDAEFCERLDAAVAENDPDLRAKRIDFARRNSWPARVAVLERAMGQCFPKVSILIVSYNSAEFLEPCLRSILANTSYPTIEVIVVDNASTDNSVAVAERFQAGDSRFRVERLPANLGFAGGNNAAARLATGEFLIFLNADTIVTPGWIAYLLSHLIADSSIGLICPVTNFAGNEVKINVDYGNEAGLRDFAMRIARQKRGSRMDIDVAPLFCAAMRRDLFAELGGLDEGYRIGMFEDDDLAEAVRQRGLRVCAAEDCFIHHFGQGAFAKLDPHEYNRIFEANRQRFEEKWKKTWVPHRTRPDVRPAHEEKRFILTEFCDVVSPLPDASSISS
jgi:GT2 family glycosyltransferase/glycosyltransferase involved in cell wall biosynthesis/SAM-dependent methyltransferase